MEAQWESELHYNEDPGWTADSDRMTPHRTTSLIIQLAEDEDSGGGVWSARVRGMRGMTACLLSLSAVPLRTPPPPPVAL